MRGAHEQDFRESQNQVGGRATNAGVRGGHAAPTYPEDSMVSLLALSSLLLASPSNSLEPTSFDTLPVADAALVGLEQQVEAVVRELETAPAAFDVCDELFVFNFTDCDLYLQLVIDCDGDGKEDARDDVWVDAADKHGPGSVEVDLWWWIDCVILDIEWIESYPADCVPFREWDKKDDCVVYFF